jgi:hypothetical protein
LTKSKGIEKCVPSEGSSSFYIDSFYPRSPWLNFKDSQANFVEGVDDPPPPPSSQPFENIGGVYWGGQAFI